MTEAGGPVTQAGIRYQDQVAALYLGRLIDPRERPRNDHPAEVRLEAPEDVDDFAVRFADGSCRYFQVKLSLKARGDPWKALWSAFRRQLDELSPDDRLELVLGEPTQLASNLSELTTRNEGSDAGEWQERLAADQRNLVSSIAKLLGDDNQGVWRLATRLDVSVWPAKALERDYAPQWMPPSTVSTQRLFRTLTEMAWEGATVRARFDGASLRDRLRAEGDIVVADPPHWGTAKYRKAIAALSVIEVPGTGFRQAADAAYLWPRSLRYDRDRRPDFDDDLPGWRYLSASATVELRNFPSIDLDAVVVVAGPGFGKTTLVNAIARKAALAGLLPAIVPITKLSESNVAIASYLSETLNGEFDVRVDWRAAAVAGSLVLLLDGLDEVSSDRRTLILERLKVYRASHPGVRWLMTVRDAAALAPPEGATTVELAPLQDEDIRSYVDFYRPGEPGVAKVLVDRIESRPDLAHLARIPIFLALMLVMRQEKEDLRRSDLLDTYLETLFRPATFKITEIDTIGTAVLRRIAERAAFESLETDWIGVSIKLLDRCVHDIAPTIRTDDVREALVRRGVLRSSTFVRLSFPFPIVQEYLASAELLECRRDELAQRLVMITRRPWAQAIQFALERHPDPEPLIAQILEREDDVFHTGLRLLGRCLANGMAASAAQRHIMGDRFAAVWGRSPWRTNKLIDGIIVDAFSRPLHPAIRARLGDRWLIHDGADAIVARLRDAALSLSVLSELLDGDIERMLNLGELQREVDRLGTDAFTLYIARCRRSPGKAEDEQAISALIGHMKIGCVDVAAAYAAASDETLPLEVRLASWGQSARELDGATEELILKGMANEGYHPMASAAQALSSPKIDIASIVRLLRSPRVPAEHALKVMEFLIVNWVQAKRNDRLDALLAADGLSEAMHDLASLYAVNAGDVDVFDTLLDRIKTMNTDMVAATVALFGHVLERSRVECAVAAIADRAWDAKDRVSIASSLATGLTSRMKMFGMGSVGALEPIPPHPGRMVPYSLFEKWMALDDYEPRDRLRLSLDAARLGVPGSAINLRLIFDAAMAVPADEEDADGALAGRALEVLHANGEAPVLDELERLALSATYNLASSVVALIAKGGTQLEADSLMRLHETVQSAMLRSAILGVLEPRAGRLGLRITRSGKKLSATAI